ncbi:universal stress protein [Phenylobacterium sp.]|uniref:universal stress protein n=1 Tax=Phenylobacterium sp. TaxID=1871053 RepID=UPI0035B12E1D
MTYKTILTHVQPDAEAVLRLQSAVDVAGDFGAHLIGLGAEALPPLGFADPYGFAQGDMIVAMRSAIEVNAAAAEAAFRAKAGRLSNEWRISQDIPTQAMARAARAADLIVAGGAPRGTIDIYRIVDTGELAVNAGRPVLVAPPTGGRLQAKGVVLAWKDTREARRALSDSMPFLKRAERVTVLGATLETDTTAVEFQVNDVAAALARHGVPAKAKVVTPKHEEDICGEIFNEAVSIDADLVVAGAYGHSRLQEWVLGGVTRDLLNMADRFVLLSH